MAQRRGRSNVTNIYIVNNDPNVQFDASNYADLLRLGAGMIQGQNITVTPQGVVVEDLRAREEMRRQRAEEEARKMREEAEKKKKWDAAAKKFPSMQEKSQEDWKRTFKKHNYREEETFYELYIHKCVDEFLKKAYTVFLLAQAGDGKTATARYFAYEKTKDANGTRTVEILHIDSYEEWKEKVKGDRRQIIIIDDIFGKLIMNARKVEMWQDVLYDMRRQVKIADGNLTLIVTCDLQVYTQVKTFLRGREMFPATETINLTEALRSADDDSRVKLLEKVLGSSVTYGTRQEIKKSGSNLPIGCRVLASINRSREHHKYKSIYSDAYFFLELDIDHVYHQDHALYAIVNYVALKNHAKLKFDSLDELPDRDRELFKVVLRSQEVDPDDLEPWILNILVQMVAGVFFLNLGDGTYRMINPGMRAAFLNQFSHRHIDIILEYLDRDDLADMLTTPGTFLSFQQKVIVVPYNALDLMARRMVFEALQGQVRYVCSHNCFMDEKFTIAFFEYMVKLGNKDAVLRTRDEADKSILYWAAWYGRDHMLLHLLQDEEFWESTHEEERNMAFVFALYRGCYRSLKIFFEKRNYSPDELPPLEMEDVEELHGWQFNYELSGATTPVQLVAYSHCLQTARDILALCKNYDVPNRYGMTPMHIAAETGSNDVIVQILDKGMDINAKTPRGTTVIQLAIFANNTFTARTVVGKGADVKQPTDDGHPLLHIAINMGNKEVMAMLLDNNVDKNEGYIKTWRPLIHALHLGHVLAAEFLLERKCDTFINFYPQDTPFHWALETNDMEMCELLMDYGLYIKATGANCWYPLHVAAKKGNDDVIRTLLKIGADPCSKNTSGETPKAVANKFNKMSSASLLWNDNPDNKRKQQQRRPYGSKYRMYDMDMMYNYDKYM